MRIPNASSLTRFPLAAAVSGGGALWITMGTTQPQHHDGESSPHVASQPSLRIPSWTPTRIWSNPYSFSSTTMSWPSPIYALAAPTQCEAGAASASDDEPTAAATTMGITRPSWIRRALQWCRILDLPLPRLLHPGDPSLGVPAHLLRQRQSDEARIQSLQRQMQTLLTTTTTPQARQKALADLALQQYQIMYGPNVTPQERQDFLAKYGCTGWTVPLIQRLGELGQGRGFVELGAGHGQWARALVDEQQVRQLQQQQQQQPPKDKSPLQNPRDFVLAYDDQSRLPLNPQVYHEKTRPHAAYFGTVLPCHSDPSVVLNQWRTRRRILLLVFPTPALAVETLCAYAQVGPDNDTLVYVGEGRGGANAGEEFFDLLEQGGTYEGEDASTPLEGGAATEPSTQESSYKWVLMEVHEVQPFGTKGFEKCFIFQKQPQ